MGYLHSGTEIQTVIERLRSMVDVDFDIVSPDGAILFVLFNRHRAVVVYMPREGTAGMHARALDDAGERFIQDFVLSNGQVDEFDPEDTVSKEEALQAIEEFAQT